MDKIINGTRVIKNPCPFVLEFSHRAWEDQQLLVDYYGLECTWVGGGRIEDGRIVIEAIYIPKQRTSAARVETVDGWYADFKAQYPNLEPLLWGHSHVNMGVHPSAQDNQTWDSFLDIPEVFGGFQGYAMIILNKRGESFSRIALPNEKVGVISWDNPIIEVRQNTRRQLYLARLLEERAERITIPTYQKGKKGWPSVYNFKDGW